MRGLIRTTQFLFCRATQTIAKERTKISKFQLKNFSDSVKVVVKAGDGGNGAIAYFTDKRVRRGKPYGGDGGNGGNIEIQAHSSMHDLSHLRLKTIQGVDGKKGGSNGRMGRNGGKTLIRVPSGTLIYQLDLLQDKQTKHLLADLSFDKQQCVVARGGTGGKGNKMNPGMFEEQRMGFQGERKTIYLQLKTLADIGLVGFPNIGKSTFLAAVTRALPKIANYEFTTLKPSVGHVKFVDDFGMTIADIPGIIEGAHHNKGLGLEFLRHIQRTKILIFMLDITHSDPLQQYRILQQQLQQYKGDIFRDRKRIVVFNKQDCLQDSQLKYHIFADKIAAKCFLTSAKEGQGLGQVLVELRKLKQEIEVQQKQQEQRIRLTKTNEERSRK